jgi:branched-chain amino acid transport system substrate-binding protein
MIKLTIVPRFLVLATIVALIGCSSEFSEPSRPRRIINNGVSYPATQQFGVLPSTLNPWEKFQFGKDISGSIISDPYLVKGDEAFARGDRKEALEYYRKAWVQNQPFVVKEALALRVSAAQLGLDQGKESLVTLSQFFRENNIGIDGVKGPFALVFAYGYGRTGDIEQSLAWFSRLEGLAQVENVSTVEAQIGSTLLLRSRGDSEIGTLARSWSTDPFISTMIKNEQSRRSRDGGIIASAPNDKPFWLTDSGESSAVPSSEMVSNALNQLSGPGVVVGTLIPKSGKYSNLGESLTSGIELALTDTPFPVRIVSEDTIEDSVAAVSAADKLIATNPAVVLGPLLSEPAAAVLPIMRERGVPQISFSRRQTPGFGNTSFLLGATSESQVSSLFTVAQHNLKIDRIAVVYSQDSNGFEFLREARRIAAELGMEIVYETPYGSEYGESFVTIAQELEKANPSGVFFPDEISKATVLVSNFTPAFRKKVKILGSAAWDNVAKLNSARTLLEGCVYVSPYFTRSQREIIKRFNTIYKNSYGVEPDFLAAQGFDAATMALAAISRNQSEGISFEDAFRAIDNYDGLTGKMKVRSDGVVERQYSVIQLGEKGLIELNLGSDPIL